jgi:Putative beta-barrel porin-2, OmpL-like. bbp2
MKKNLFGLSLAVLMIFPLVMDAGGEEAKPEAKPVTSLEDIKNLLGMSIYLQGGYTFNFQTPDSMTNEQRLFDSKANSFLLDLAQVQFAKDPAVGGLGYKLKLSYGETAKFIHSAGLGNPNDEFDLTEAYMNYVAPLGSGLRLQFGKFVTYNGAEVIEARDNFNYSRSFLFNFAVPFTHTGLMGGYKFSDALTVNLYLVNGWDVTNDNNNAKTFGASFVVTPIEPLGLTFNFTYGPEQANNTSNYRFLFDWIGAYKATKSLTFMANVDYGHEAKDPLNGGQDSEWWGVAGYAKYEFTDFFSSAIRAEYFNDEKGVRTGIAQELKEVTLTVDFKVAKNLLLRPEYRHDWSTNNAFDSKQTFDTRNQDTVAVGMMYTW